MSLVFMRGGAPDHSRYLGTTSRMRRGNPQPALRIPRYLHVGKVPHYLGTKYSTQKQPSLLQLSSSPTRFTIRPALLHCRLDLSPPLCFSPSLSKAGSVGLYPPLHLSTVLTQVLRRHSLTSLSYHSGHARIRSPHRQDAQQPGPRGSARVGERW